MRPNYLNPLHLQNLSRVRERAVWQEQISLIPKTTLKLDKYHRVVTNKMRAGVLELGFHVVRMVTPT